MDAQQELLVKAAINYFPHVVVGIIAWLALRAVNAVDAQIKDLMTRVCNVEKSQTASQKVLVYAEGIANEWAVMKKGISDTEATLRQASEKIESISVLKRDRDAAFMRIDEIREQLQAAEKSLIERCHTLSNRLTAVRQALDSHDIDVNFD
jgi:small-conductance mechanosensitive channel